MIASNECDLDHEQWQDEFYHNQGSFAQGVGSGIKVIKAPVQDNIVEVCKWPDGTMCEPEELEEYLTFMSDDYEVVSVTLEEYGVGE